MDTTTARARRAHVAEIMTRDPISLAEGESVHFAGFVLLREGISAAPVIDRDGALVGVFSHSDVLAKFAAGRQRRGALARVDDRRARATTVGDACSRPAITIGPTATVDTAARALLDHDVGRLIVVEHGEVVGVVSRNDVLKLFLPEWEDGGHGDRGGVDRDARTVAPRLSQTPPD